MNIKIPTVVLAGLLLAAGFGASALWSRQAPVVYATAGGSLIEIPGEYHAVALTNGAVYIGKLSGYGSENPVLTNVYYVQCDVDKETKAVTNLLVKRGKEWHGPDRMFLNPQHILLVEPVSATSRVTELIKGRERD
jgi:hypothetical protein